MMDVIVVVVSILGFIISLFALAVGLWSAIESKALRQSTHTIIQQQQPLDQAPWPEPEKEPEEESRPVRPIPFHDGIL